MPTSKVSQQALLSPEALTNASDRTPPKGKYTHILPFPSTPTKKRVKRRRIQNTSEPYVESDKRLPCQPFQADHLPLTNSLSPFPFEIPKLVEIKGYYKPTSGQEYLCIKQPPQKQSCGPGAILMFLSHFIHLHPRIQLTESFWRYYFEAICINQIDIIVSLEEKTNITSFSYQVKGAYYYKDVEMIKNKSITNKDSRIDYVTIQNFHEDILQRIKLIQKQLHSPIIVSITNPQIDGHWILIDCIMEDGVYIRDPFHGQAHKLSLKELYQNWEAEDEVKVIYLHPSRRPLQEIPFHMAVSCKV